MSDMNKSVVTVKNLHKTFKLPNENHSGIKQAILNIFKKNKVKGYTNQKVLRGVSFDIKQGDFFGVVGRNGSGKSTLLKLLAGIYTPDNGSISTDGTIVPFIELGVGFNPELTGRENIFLNGALLGFSRSEMQAMYDEIVDFAELHKFMDQKLKNYSSGMQVRLAFSIAIKAQGDILILDEVLAVGDEAFQRKCNDFFEAVKKDKTKTVILVTHSMGSVKQYCNKAIMLKDGEIVSYGSPDDVANLYSEENFGPLDGNSVRKGSNQGLSELVPEFELNALTDSIVKSGDNFTFEIKYRVTDDIEVFPSFSFTAEGMGKSIFDVHKPEKTTKGAGTYKYRYKIPINNLNNADYNVIAVLRDAKTEDQIAFITSDNAIRFKISKKTKGRKDNGLLNIKGEYLIEGGSV